MIVRSLVALAVATAALGVAACGAESPSSASSSGREAQMRRALLDYARCMREHGVDMPDPQFSSDGGGATIRQRGPGPDLAPEERQAAEEACKHFRAQIKPPNLSDAEKEENKKAALANSRCMREHGISNFPDPQFDENGGAMIKLRGGGELDPDSPKFKAAEKACRSTLPDLGAKSSAP